MKDLETVTREVVDAKTSGSYELKEHLFALLDWIDYGDKEDKEHIVETYLKDI